MKAWFTVPLAACAPHNDLQLLKDLRHSYDFNDKVLKATSVKLVHHLWNLSEQLVGLTFFDANVSSATKREMVKFLKDREGESKPLECININVRLTQECQLQDFVTQNTQSLFDKLDISSIFLDHDPEPWTSIHSYSKERKLLLMITQKGQLP